VSRYVKNDVVKQQLELFVQSLIGRLTRKLNGPHVYALVTKAETGLFAVDPEDCMVGKRLRRGGQYGIDEIERLRPHLNPECSTLIVGAHIGTLAVPISRFCKDVVAIEANPDTYKLLTINIALNAISNCHAVNVAASSKDEQIKFLLSRANSGGSKRVPKHKEYKYYYDNPEEVAVRAVSLDEFLDDKDFDVVVMDIEGSEYFALQGMQRILSRAKLLAVEFLPHHLKNVSGATVAQFLSVIAPHFCRMTIPSMKKTVDASQFAAYLTEMYDKEQGDDGIIFEKV